MTIDYTDFLNETKMDIPRDFLLFSDVIRISLQRREVKFGMFSDFYAQPNLFYALSEISDYRTKRLVKQHDGTRFTLLRSTTFQDNTLEGRQLLSVDEIENILANRNEYYFYDLVRGTRMANEAPNREHHTDIMHGDDGEDWFFIIKKGINCLLVKTQSRQEGGSWAEHQLGDKYGWERQQTSIIVKKFRLNNVNVVQANNFLRQIIDREDIELFRVNEEENENTFSKYDLLIDNRLKIEIKKYSESKILYNGRPKAILLAEQFKIADRTSLKKLVRWYYESSNDPLSEELLQLSERTIAERFKGNSQVVRSVKQYHNSKIGRMETVLNRVPADRWMSDVYGIYFAPERSSRKFDFLIKMRDENRRNVNCVWETITRHWGLDRLELSMRVNPESIEYILTPNNVFVAAYRLRDYVAHKQGRIDGILTVMNGDRYVFNAGINRWELTPPI